jgi:dolichol-phosphate mannosyltransferase
VQDLMSGFFAIRRDRFDVVAPRLTTSGFKILADIIASTPIPLRITEVGYTFRERGNGDSKLDAKVALDFAAFLVNKITWELIPIRFVLFAGAVANVGIGSWVFDRTYIWWLAGLSGLVIGSVWNYTLSSLFVWSRRG